jgi:hypothetical protein
MQRLSALASVDAAARLELLRRLFELTATIAILVRTKMNPRIPLSDLVAMRLTPAMRCYAVKDVARYFGRDATTFSATLSRYNGKVEKQPEMRRKLFRLKGLSPMPVPKSLCAILRVLPNVGL